ncbi:hypothetical protein [Paenibacillus graminis]|uniref:hypothetical protein n=1 Tax=Paenibacillus graminis TaxID=189425 RepID=UPI0030C8EE60
MPSTKNRITPTERLYFHSELRQCSHCGTKLKRHHTAWHKYVNTFEWSLRYLEYGVCLPSPGLPLSKIVLSFC